MKLTALFGSILLLGACSAVHAADPDPHLAFSKNVLDTAKALVKRAAAKMPEDKYAFRPSSDVRTFGETVAHIADSQVLLCTLARDGKPAASPNYEKNASSKAAALAALDEAFALCDQMVASLTAASSVEMVNFFGQKAPRSGVIYRSTGHMFQHYGNLSTYLRMNGLVPPTSER